MKGKLRGRLAVAAAILMLALLCSAAASAAGVLRLPENTQRIESRAFSGVRPTYVDFPAGITYIAEDAFDTPYSFIGRGPSGTYAEAWCINHNITYQATRYYALLVGNGTGYYDSDDWLYGISNDISAMRQTLSGMPQNWQITVRENRTAGQILSDIRSAFGGKNSADVFLFYYSGHGDDSYGSSAGSLVGVDYSYVYPSSLASTLYNYTAGRVIVLLDSCGSGSYIYPNGEEIDYAEENFTLAVTSAFEAYNGRGDQDVLPNTGELLNADKFSVLAACAYGHTSSGGYIYRSGSTVYSADGSVFTYGLVRSLGCTYPGGVYTGSMSGDTNRDGKITLTEAYNGINSYIWQMDRLAPDLYRQWFYQGHGYWPSYIPDEWTYWSDQATQIAGQGSSVIFFR